MANESSNNATIIREIDYVSPVEWLGIFSTHAEQIGGFEGDAKNAAALMANFGRGREWIRTYFVGKVEVAIPDIWILHSDTHQVEPDIFYYRSEDRTTSALVVKKDRIEVCSDFEPDQTRTVMRVADGKTFKISPSDDFSLAGVEEAHHSVFYGLNPDTNENEQKQTAVSRGDYHAIESEWQALAFQIQYAKAHALSSDLISTLIETRTEASAIREQFGLDVDNAPYLPANTDKF